MLNGLPLSLRSSCVGSFDADISLKSRRGRADFKDASLSLAVKAPKNRKEWSQQ